GPVRAIRPIRALHKEIETVNTGEAIPTITIDPDRTGALLDELDDLIALIDTVMQEQITARVVLADAELEQAIIEAEHTLNIEGRNDAERKARLTLALRDDVAYQTHASAAREARGMLHDCERRLTVARLRVTLIRVALQHDLGEP